MKPGAWIRAVATTALLLMVGSGALAAAGVQAGPLGAPTTAPDTAAAEQRLLGLMNHERTSRGLRPLARRDDVDGIARAHSARMAPAETLWHNDDYFTSATKNVLGASILGENVARNDDVDDMHNRLMNSPPHRANILNPRFTVVGVGVVFGSNGQWFGTEDFMEPRPVAAAKPPAPAPVAASSTAAKPAARRAARPAAPAPVAAAPAVAPVAVADGSDVAFPALDMVGAMDASAGSNGSLATGSAVSGAGSGRGGGMLAGSGVALAGLLGVTALGRRRLRRA